MDRDAGLAFGRHLDQLLPELALLEGECVPAGTRRGIADPLLEPQRTEVESPAETEARVENARRLEEVLAELDSKTLGATPLMPLDSARLDWTSDVLLGGASLPDGRRL